MIIALVADLIFDSKLETAAAQVGATLKTVRTAAAVRASAAHATALIIDLVAADADAADIIRDAKAQRPTLPVVAFGSHVDVAAAEAARAAGADYVLARSEFTTRLNDILASLASPKDPA